jgi:DNA replication initiation complex subunit (GINS family)
MQITLSFDTDAALAGRIYQLLVEAHQAHTVSVEPPTAIPAETEVPADRAEAIKLQRQAAAAKARAAKDAKAKPQTPVTDVLGPDEVNQPNGEDQQDQEEDLGMAPPSLSPGEAKDAALALVREIYAAGKVAQVKALQKEWQVAKFYDVPVDQAYAFHQSVMKVAVDTGLRK